MIHGIMIKRADVELVEKLNGALFNGALFVHEIDGFMYLFIDDIETKFTRDECLEIIYHVARIIDCMSKETTKDEKLPSLSSILEV